MQLSISFVRCPGCNCLNNTRPWIADAVHSTYLKNKTPGEVSSVQILIIMQPQELKLWSQNRTLSQ